MTICPIALAVGCEKCPAFKFCPLTTILGDQDEVDSSNNVSKWTEKDWEEMLKKKIHEKKIKGEK